MKKTPLALLAIFFLVCSVALAQSPFKRQLVIPVHIDTISEKASIHEEKQSPDAFLSGIALMFLDTANTSEELLLSGHSDMVIWRDKVGQSTVLTLVVPGSKAVGKLELTYLESNCSVGLWRTDQDTGEEIHAYGNLKNGSNGHSLRFIKDGKASSAGFVEVIDALNRHLMELHTRNLRKAQVKSWYNKDSINLIIGKDSQFNTDSELLWFDLSLRNRLAWVAANDFSRLFLLSSDVVLLQDSIEKKNSIVRHDAKRMGKIHGKSIKGNITVNVKPDNIGGYMFFNPQHSFRISVDYTYSQGNNNQNNLTINRFSLKNLSNGDFVDMDLFDFVSNGLPIMYVDLIIGVVTDSQTPWDISKVINFIEEVFNRSVLPYELGF